MNKKVNSKCYKLLIYLDTYTYVIMKTGKMSFMIWSNTNEILHFNDMKSHDY